MEKIENGQELMKHTSRIKLYIMRHAEKEGQNKIDHVDSKIALTPKGRSSSIARSHELDVKQGIVIAGDRDRTQVTGLYAYAGKNEKITGEETFDELRAKVDSGLKYGSRMLIDERLNLAFKKGTPESEDLQKAGDEGRYVKRIIEKHDDLVEHKGKDDGSSTYAKHAKNVAELIQKYVGIAPRWNNLANDKVKKYADTMERVMATHGGVSESFLAEVIDKRKGREERDRFVQAVPNGFDYLGQFDVEIDTMQDGTIKLHVHVDIQDEENPYLFSEYIPVSMLEDIINDYS